MAGYSYARNNFDNRFLKQKQEQITIYGGAILRHKTYLFKKQAVFTFGYKQDIFLS